MGPVPWALLGPTFSGRRSLPSSISLVLEPPPRVIPPTPSAATLRCNAGQMGQASQSLTWPMYNGRRSLPSATFCLPGPPPRSTLFIPRPAAIRWNPLSTRQAPRSLIRASFRGRGRPPPTTYRVARSIFHYRAGLIPKPSKGRVFAGAGILRRPSSYVRSPIPRSVFLYPASHSYTEIRKSWPRPLKPHRARTSFVSVHLLSSGILS